MQEHLRLPDQTPKPRMVRIAEELLRLSSEKNPKISWRLMCNNSDGAISAQLYQGKIKKGLLPNFDNMELYFISSHTNNTDGLVGLSLEVFNTAHLSERDRLMLFFDSPNYESFAKLHDLIRKVAEPERRSKLQEAPTKNKFLEGLNRLV